MRLFTENLINTYYKLIKNDSNSTNQLNRELVLKTILPT